MPEQFGRYELLSCIGKGGMAEVFRARLEVPAGAEKILVIKRILAPFSSDPEFISLFVNEAKIALPLTHGNITSVFEFGEVEGLYYLAMEYIHGQNLERVLERCRDSAAHLPVEAALFIGAEIARGLAYAHGFTTPKGRHMEVVHLDVTPQNVLVSYDGAVKLTDFGIAKAKASHEATANEELRGKASYMSPEQVNRGAVDARTDIYALGGVLYELLTNRRPYEGSDDLETIEMVRSGELAAPSKLRAGIEDLDALVLKAMAKNPAERYQSAAEFQTALTQALFKRNDGYGSHQLGAHLRELFAWDIYDEQTPALKNDGLRDRLLFQLSKAQVTVEKAHSTSELLALRTVSIPPPPPPDPNADLVRKKEKMRTVLGAVAGAVVVVAAIVGGIVALGPGEQDAHKEATRPDAGPISESMGRLSLNSWPTSAVFLDGKRIPGMTPILNYEVTPGDHVLLFVRQDYDLQKKIIVKVPAGVDKTVVVKLER